MAMVRIQMDVNENSFESFFQGFSNRRR